MVRSAFSPETILGDLVEVVAEVSDPSGGYGLAEGSPETRVGPVSRSGDLEELCTSEHSVSAQDANDVLDLRIRSAVGPRRR
jgi:hypothetical protein